METIKKNTNTAVTRIKEALHFAWVLGSVLVGVSVIALGVYAALQGRETTEAIKMIAFYVSGSSAVVVGLGVCWKALKNK